MRKILLAITLFTYLFNYAVTITSTATTLGGQPAFQFEVTDPLYMPAFYYDDMLDAYPPDGWSFFWQTDEGAVSTAEKPIFHFRTTGAHEVSIVLTPRKKEVDILKVFHSYTFTVAGGENSNSNNGDIMNDAIYFEGTPRNGDKAYIVVPLNSCDVITAPHQEKVSFDDTKLQFIRILDVGLFSGSSVVSEADIAMGLPTNKKVNFTVNWTSLRTDVAAVLEFDVISSPGEEIAVKHTPDRNLPKLCKSASEALEFGTIGPYDPNYKESDHYNINVLEVDSSKTDSTTVEYTIHFQNIGTGPVDSITVVDTLPEYLVFDSHIASSLPAAKVNVSVTGNIVTWKLAPNADIKGTNESPSQPEYTTKGWVKFKTRLAPVDSITYDTCHCLCNRATIYFDNLDPITTKADIIAIGDRLCFSFVDGKDNNPKYADDICRAKGSFYGSKEIEVNSVFTPTSYQQLSLYPNPTSGKVTLGNELLGNVKIQVYNNFGKLVKEIETDTRKLDISLLSSGVYTLKIENKKKVYISRLVRY
jgi:uncharacterized repeat protein (TIGR01451 family)